MKKRSFKKKMTLFIITCLVAVTCLQVFANLRIDSSSQGRVFDDLEKIPHRRVGLVLGCRKHVAGGRTNLFFKYRMDAAARLYNAGMVDYLLVSGDNSTKDYSEVDDMQEALEKRGVPTAKIFKDHAGFRTLDSIVRAKEVFCLDDLTVVSQEFHNKRALFIADCKDINAVAFNAASVGGRHGLKAMLREQLAKTKAVLDIYVLRKQPKFLGEKIRIVSEPGDVQG